MSEILSFACSAAACGLALYSLSQANKAQRAVARAEQLAAQATETAQRAASAKPSAPLTFGSR